MPAPDEARPAGRTRDRGDLRLGANAGPREEFAFRTADGVRSPDSFRPTELGLLDALAEAVPTSLLVTRANYGVVGVVMGAFTGEVRMIERSARAARLCRANAERNDVDSSVRTAIAADPRTLPARFEAAALAPAAYEPCEVVEQRLAAALAALEPGGTAYLAVADDAGASRYRRTLEDLCARTAVVDDRSDHLVLCGRRPPAFDPPRFADPRTFEATVDGTSMTFVSYPGLFAASAIDEGTRALAEAVDVEDGERVLDLACGYGPLGTYAALTADCDVTLTDDDLVATACARQSTRLSGVPDVEVELGDGVAAVRDSSFDRIVCNPPTHAGSGVLHDLVRGARDVLAPDGELHLVHHRGIEFDRYLDPSFERTDAVVRGEYRLVTATAP